MPTILRVHDPEVERALDTIVTAMEAADPTVMADIAETLLGIDVSEPYNDGTPFDHEGVVAMAEGRLRDLLCQLGLAHGEHVVGSYAIVINGNRYTGGIATREIADQMADEIRRQRTGVTVEVVPDE